MKDAPHFSGKPGGAHEVVGADGIQHVVDGGQQRFADVKARKVVALEKDDRCPARASHAAGRRSGWPSADDDDIGVVRRKMVRT